MCNLSHYIQPLALQVSLKKDNGNLTIGSHADYLAQNL